MPSQLGASVPAAYMALTSLPSGAEEGQRFSIDRLDSVQCQPRDGTLWFPCV